MSPRILPLLAAACAATMLTTLTPAQIVGGEWPTKHFLPDDDSGYAQAACRIEDIDADGVADFAVGLPFFSPLAGTEAGAVRIFSGDTGLLLRTHYGSGNFDHLGQALSGLSDINGDGIGDYLVAAPQREVGGLLQAGSVFLYSGADGSQLLQLHGSQSHGLFGFAVSSVGDFDGDLIEDLLIGAPGHSPNGQSGAGKVFLYSAASGTLLASFSGTMADDSFGYSVSNAGDVNQDGFPDVLVGAIGTDVNFRSNCGSAYVYSGFRGTLLWRVDGTSSNEFLGRAVASAGDLNHDGYADLLIGAPGAAPNNLAFAGSAFVYSGVDGTSMFRFDGQNPNEALGSALANAGDINDDGFEDIVVGAPDANFQTGYVAVYSGVDGSLMHLRNDAPWPTRLGFAVCSMGDLNGDGRAEVLATAPHTTPTILAFSYVYVYGFDPYLTIDQRTLSDSVGGTVVFTIDFPTPLGSNEYKLLGSNLGTTATSILGVEVPLIARGPVWDALAATTPPAIFVNATGTLNADGNATAILTLPAGAASAFIDTNIYFSVLALQPPSTGLAASAAVTVRVLP